ncbi:MAG: hypothetical protein ACOC16_02505 [Nanoarchaeota archaeon]
MKNIKNEFSQYFSYGSILSLILFVLGNYIIFLILINNTSLGVFLMLIGLFIYILNNFIVNKYKLENSFNDFLENIAVLWIFGFSTVIFGIVYYNENPALLAIILFYSLCLILSLARNNVLSLKNSIGWPVPLNGLFFPLIYFFYVYYFNDAQNTIFIFYYIFVGILLVSSYNFLGFENNQYSSERKKRDEQKSFPNEENNNYNDNKFENENGENEEEKSIENEKKILEDKFKTSVDNNNNVYIDNSNNEEKLKNIEEDEINNKQKKHKVNFMIKMFDYIKNKFFKGKNNNIIDKIDNEIRIKEEEKVSKEEVEEVFSKNNVNIENIPIQDDEFDIDLDLENDFIQKNDNSVKNNEEKEKLSNDDNYTNIINKENNNFEIREKKEEKNNSKLEEEKESLEKKENISIFSNRKML